MLTVALPIYRMKQIAWLTFEGLARQQHTPNYELIVCEERHSDECGNELIEKYKERLLANGCVNIKMITLANWVSLAKKWQLIGKHTDENSKGFMLQAADCYPHPLRLRQAMDAINKGAEWYHESEGYFFDLSMKRTIIYEHSTLEGCDWKTGLNMTLATKYAKTIPDTEKLNGIDHFLFQHCLVSGMKKVVMESPKAIGVDTNSANNISHFRIMKFMKPTPPFKATDKNINSIGLPIDIVNELRGFNLVTKNTNKMRTYEFIKSRNVYKKGQIVELSDVVADLYLSEGIVKPLIVENKIQVKELKPVTETKPMAPVTESKTEVMTSKTVANVSKGSNKRGTRKRN